MYVRIESVNLILESVKEAVMHGTLTQRLRVAQKSTWAHVLNLHFVPTKSIKNQTY